MKKIKMNMANKLTLLLLCFATFVVTSYSMLFYFVSESRITEAAGMELVGCASITSGLISEELLVKVVAGDKQAIEEARKQVDWIVDSKPIFKDALIIDQNGKILVADKRILKEGSKEGDTFYVDQTVLQATLQDASHNGHGEHDTYTDIYEFNGHNRMAGYSEIANTKGIQAVMVIEFDEDIIQERTWENVWPALEHGWYFPVFGLFVMNLIFRRSVKPLIEMSKEVDKIAQGDLTFEPTIVHTKDEIGSLSRSIHGMATSLADVIGKVNETGERLTKSSNLLHKEVQLNLNSTRQISDDIENLSEGAKNQLFQTKESAAAMDEISSQVIHVAKNSDVMKKSTANTAEAIQEMASSIEQVSKGSEHASKLAEEVQQDAINGKGHVDHSKEEMIEIAKIIEKASNVMQNLGKSSQEIGRIVEVIDGIAEQTNLLALNAAIEAARAGEHGKGFSVVADEVKNLAERSANATKEIAHLIKGIQEETNQAVEAIEVGSQKVSQGNQLAEAASSAIEQIVQGVKQISNELLQISFSTAEQAKQSNSVVNDISTLEEQVNQVAKATQEQTIGVDEITKAIGKIAEISQNSTQQLQDVVHASQNGETAIETISDSAKALEELSDELQEIVGKFQIKK